MLKNSEDLKRASYWAFVIIALITIPVFFSGTQAVAVVENLPNISESIIHEHREIAEQTLIALEILGLISLAGLFLFRGLKKSPIWFTISLLVFAIISTGLASWTGVREGVIRHTEVRGELKFLMLNETQSDVQKGLQTGHEHSH
ncbi:hypothetical protein [Fischerella sp. JS2]|uniref:hypothetical protein n=1 Tax=Fischerella sp. JS2 TaxID=2597771 RepID=UPI0028F00A9B|nr:hypothetical protein [Fischerella sp. JS2]